MVPKYVKNGKWLQKQKKGGKSEKKEQHAEVPGPAALDQGGTSLTRPCRPMQTKTKNMHWTVPEAIANQRNTPNSRNCLFGGTNTDMLCFLVWPMSMSNREGRCLFPIMHPDPRRQLRFVLTFWGLFYVKHYQGNRLLLYNSFCCSTNTEELLEKWNVCAPSLPLHPCAKQNSTVTFSNVKIQKCLCVQVKWRFKERKR